MVLFYEHGSELSDSVKGGEFMDYLCNSQILMDNHIPWSYLILF
jgi:hypothetical protein